MTSPEAQAAFDIDREPDAVRDAYGRNPSASAPCWPAGWSRPACRSSRSTTAAGTTTRASSTTLQQAPARLRDQPIAALIEDLDQRGLLETTLVIALGEFGRTPQDQQGRAAATTGPTPCRVLFAGGGTPGGQVVGATDAKGYAAVERVLSPENFAVDGLHQARHRPRQDPLHPQRPAGPPGQRPDADPRTDGLTGSDANSPAPRAHP